MVKLKLMHLGVIQLHTTRSTVLTIFDAPPHKEPVILKTNRLERREKME